jgi:hypothetical protein
MAVLSFELVAAPCTDLNSLCYNSFTGRDSCLGLALADIQFFKQWFSHGVR